MTRLRFAAGLALCALVALFARALFAPAELEQQAPQSFTSSAQCQSCHAEVYAEWQASPHARSWTNPAVRALSNDFANTDCIDCHAPQPIFETGIAARVLPRSSRRVEGVDCIACHSLPESAGGGVAGTLTAERAACRPVERRELADPDFCAGCHNQHQTVDQWRATPFARQGVTCLDCHMPHRGGDASRGRSHASPGGTSLELLQRAVQLSGRREGELWLVSIENTGAGHSFPTDERSRAADLFWRPLRAAADSSPQPWRHLHRMRSPYRFETDLVDSLLAHGERRSFALEHADARGAIEVALFYKRSPYWEQPDAPDPEREAILVQRLELVP